MLNTETIIVIVSLMIVSIGLGIYLGLRFGKYTNQDNTIENINNSNKNFNVYDEAKNVRDSILEKMEQLKSEINADFIGLAIYETMSDEIRWRLAAGASNSRYKRIVIRMGKGIAGEVVQLNRSIKIEDFPHDVLGDPIEYPILLVEHLTSVIAVPIVEKMRIYGVLLVGQRTKRKYTKKEEEQTNLIAQEIAKDFAVANIYTRVLSGRSEDKLTNHHKENDRMNHSLFIQSLKEKQRILANSHKGHLEFEILDQSIMELSSDVQQVLDKNVDDILDQVAMSVNDYIRVIIARDEGNLMVEMIINRSIPSTREAFSDMYQRIGEIGGAIISYHEENYLHLIMEIPIWSYKNPLE